MTSSMCTQISDTDLSRGAQIRIAPYGTKQRKSIRLGFVYTRQNAARQPAAEDYLFTPVLYAAMVKPFSTTSSGIPGMNRS